MTPEPLRDDLEQAVCQEVLDHVRERLGLSAESHGQACRVLYWALEATVSD